MLALLAGLVLFLGGHCISIVNERWRDTMVARLGEGPWKGLYSVVAVAGLALILWGYGSLRGQTMTVYTPPIWLSYVALLLLAPVFPLLLATYFPGRIQWAAKHPTLVATKLWATAHLLVNGSLADVVLFGSFLAWAVADRISMQRRAQRPLPGAPPAARNDIIAAALGLTIYAALLLGAHAWLFGVSAWPG